MDWLSALCLSVPPSLAFYFGIRAALHKWDVLATTRNVAVGANVDLVVRAIDHVAETGSILAKKSRERSRAAERYARKTALLVAETEAEAAVQCARYGAKVIRGKPPKEPAKKPTAHDVWLGTEGKKLPESVRDRVEWAVLRLRGEENDDQGDEETAEAILDQFAPGLAGSTRDEVARELGAKG